MLNRFFVYGSLLSGLGNCWVVKPRWIEKREKAAICGLKLHRYGASNFPYCTESKEENPTEIVHGEIITIKEEYLEVATEAMDRLEGYHDKGYKYNFYNRKEVVAVTEDIERKECYVYILNEKEKRPAGERVLHGDWKKYAQEVLLVEYEEDEEDEDDDDCF